MQAITGQDLTGGLLVTCYSFAAHTAYYSPCRVSEECCNQIFWLFHILFHALFMQKTVPEDTVFEITPALANLVLNIYSGKVSDFRPG